MFRLLICFCLLFPSISNAASTTQPTARRTTLRTTRPSAKPKPFVIEGQVVGSQGSAVTGTEVRSIELGRGAHTVRAILNQQGRFRLTYDRPGLYELRITAPNHQPSRVGLLLSKRQHIQVCIHLKSHEATKHASLVVTHIHWKHSTSGLFDKLLRYTRHYSKMIQHTYTHHPNSPFHLNHPSEWKEAQQRLQVLQRMLAPEPKQSITRKLHKLLTLHLQSIFPKPTGGRALLKWSQALSLGHSVWGIHTRLLLMTAKRWPFQQRIQLLENIAKQHPSVQLRAELYAVLLAYRVKQLQKNTKEHTSIRQSIKRYRQQMQKLASHFKSSRLRESIQLARWYEGHNRQDTQTKSLPDFKLPLFSPKKRLFTHAHFKGKFTLLTFWATWCDACVSKMPALHDVYKRYKKHGLQIISVSYDTSIPLVETFRKNKWSMPWLHSIAKGGFDSDIGKKLKINIIPSQFLLAPNGQVLASGKNFRNERFLPVLIRWLSQAYRYNKELVFAGL